PAGDIIDSVTLVTTEANALLAPVHDRMPVLLAPESYGIWLDPSVQDPQRLTALLKPCSGDELVVQPVSARVNNTREDDAALIEGEKQPNRSA
ncbi:MAG: SOS response-associated peptidase family protein, partial [Gammaproteobacteria bacterium]